MIVNEAFVDDSCLQQPFDFLHDDHFQEEILRQIVAYLHVEECHQSQQKMQNADEISTVDLRECPLDRLILLAEASIDVLKDASKCFLLRLLRQRYVVEQANVSLMEFDQFRENVPIVEIVLERSNDNGVSAQTRIQPVE